MADRRSRATQASPLQKCTSAIVFASLLLAGCGDAPPPAVPRTPVANVAGTNVIRGRVTFDGPVPERKTVRNSPCCPGSPPTLLDESVVVNPDGTLANVFVYLEGGPLTDGSALPPAKLDQVYCQYIPHALGVVVGQKLVLHSSDETTHNVRITPQTGRVINEYMTGAGQSRETSFTVPGFANSRCDVHPWMSAEVGVFDNAFFSVTGGDGTFSIGGVPDGQYTLVARHERYGTLRRPVAVSAGQATASVDFSYHPPAP